MKIKGIHANKINKLTDEILSLEDVYDKMSDAELRMQTLKFKERYNKGETLDDLLVEAFAVCREASWRVLGMKQFETQIMGGIVLHQGRVAEMVTGEGKTLTELCPAYLNTLNSKSVHIATVNNYLATRDMMQMQSVFKFLGLSVGLVTDVNGLDKKLEYDSDIVYTTNSEIGFDYLRDNMVYNKDQKVQKDRSFLILDEIDSILIDDAMTPLLIASKGEDIKEDLYLLAKQVKVFKEGSDYELDLKEHNVSVTTKGIKKVEKLFGIENISDLESSILIQHLNNALRAEYLNKKEKDYIVENGEVILIDKGTGRRADGRRLSDGLHCAIEAKEGLKINPDDVTSASLTYRNLFELYDKVSGMSGTVYTEKDEFREFYDLDIAVIPTHRERKRIDYPDRVFKTERKKLIEVIKEVKRIHATGRPILLVAPSVIGSKQLSEILHNHGVEHTLLNAVNISEEAEIISKAGEKNAITISTAVAGRGTDIKISKEVNELGGLAVIATARAFSRRVDNQLKGRAGRQGDEGTSQFFVSFEDDIFKEAYGIDHEYQLSKLKDEELKGRKYDREIRRVQNLIEGQMYSSRKYMINLTDILWAQQQAIYSIRDKAMSYKELMRYLNIAVRDKVKEIVSDIEDYDLEYVPIEERKKLLESIIQRTIEEFNITIDALKPDIRDMINIDSIEELENYISFCALTRIQYCNSFCDMENELIIRLLRVIDNAWKHHLKMMEALKLSTGYAQFKQMKADINYNIEGKKAFDSLVESIKEKYLEESFSIPLIESVG